MVTDVPVVPIVEMAGDLTAQEADDCEGRAGLGFPGEVAGAIRGDSRDFGIGRSTGRT